MSSHSGFLATIRDDEVIIEHLSFVVAGYVERALKKNGFGVTEMRAEDHATDAAPDSRLYSIVIKRTSPIAVNLFLADLIPPASPFERQLLDDLELFLMPLKVQIIRGDADYVPDRIAIQIRQKGNETYALSTMASGMHPDNERLKQQVDAFMLSLFRQSPYELVDRIESTFDVTYTVAKR